jgi:hypothetical protein
LTLHFFMVFELHHFQHTISSWNKLPVNICTTGGDSKMK